MMRYGEKYHMVNGNSKKNNNLKMSLFFCLDDFIDTPLPIKMTLSEINVDLKTVRVSIKSRKIKPVFLII